MSRKADPEYWNQILSKQNASGLTQAHWCDQNHININTFRYWKSRLSKSSQNHSKLSQTQWALVTSSKEIQKSNDIESSTLRIHVGKATIEVSQAFDSQSLSDVIKVLMEHA